MVTTTVLREGNTAQEKLKSNELTNSRHLASSAKEICPSFSFGFTTRMPLSSNVSLMAAILNFSRGTLSKQLSSRQTTRLGTLQAFFKPRVWNNFLPLWVRVMGIQCASRVHVHTTTDASKSSRFLLSKTVPFSQRFSQEFPQTLA